MARAISCAVVLAGLSSSMAIVSGCGGGTPASVEHPWRMPEVRERRQRVIREFGEKAHRALANASLDGLLLDDDGLEAILNTEGYTRVQALRLGLGSRVQLEADRHGAFGTTEFEGVCLLGSRNVEADGVEGLDMPGWVFDRALVVGSRQGARRLGAWMEGTFVFTNRGIFAIDLTRVEAPRWEHSDLELVRCDLAVGLDQ